MARIFSSLAMASLALMAIAILLGLSVGDLYIRPLEEATLRMRTVHTLTGVAAALAIVLVESIVVTYFIGTSRWCKEVTETYSLPMANLQNSTRLKRKTFPLCLVGMLTVVGVAALGAASDPGTGRDGTASMAQVHLLAACAGLGLIGWTYYRAWLNITENQVVIDHLVAEVAQIRAQRGLDHPGESAANPDANLADRPDDQHAGSTG